MESVDVALHEAAIETNPPFGIRVTVSADEHDSGHRSLGRRSAAVGQQEPFAKPARKLGRRPIAAIQAAGLSGR